jgi:hypothetical protein
MRRCSRFLFALALSAATLLSSNAAHAVSWHARSAPPSYLPATGHYYQVWAATLAEGEPFSWDAAAQFAGSLNYLGFIGYPATINTEEEAQMLSDYNELRSEVYTGGVLDQGIWKWAAGPERGEPVVFRRGTSISCGANSTVLVCWGSNWYETVRSAVYCSTCGPPNNCLKTFVLVEFGGIDPTPANRLSWGSIKSIYR